ncbi:MFS transporter [Pseudomonas putida]|uniref:MFS transporter n=1 Tax=Pseudomonas putida TaxID=303 RepID=UPI0023647854|nr:MFS transporter [Pseudomonas putida]MDD2002033.1 MFS transporter [Pseudomonas putida]
MTESFAAPAYRCATRLTFFAVGFTMAAWAPLVAFAKTRMGLADGLFGSLLLCIGLGSLISMPLAGRIAQRVGLRMLMQLSGLCFCAALLALSTVASTWLFALSLFVFGACLGLGDICVNLQAAMVEKAAQQPLMSGFHALFSVGTFVGAAGMTLLLNLGATPVQAASCAAVLAVFCLALAWRHQIVRLDTLDNAVFQWPQGVVMLIATLSFICLLVEGAMLDWSALYLQGVHQVPLESAGIAYSAFTLAMAGARFAGDRLARLLGDPLLLAGGALLSLLGLVLAQTQSLTGALAGFVLAGVGLANAVPVLFRAALQQNRMPAAASLSAVATIGYLGVLLGPGFIGHIAEVTSLHTAFWFLCVTLAALCLLARPAVTRGAESA